MIVLIVQIDGMDDISKGPTTVDVSIKVVAAILGFMSKVCCQPSCVGRFARKPYQ